MKKRFLHISIMCTGIFWSIAFRIAQAQTPQTVNTLTGHTGGNYGSFMEIINNLVNWLSTKIIPIIVGLAIISFIWNMIRFLSTMSTEKTHEEFRKYSINSLIAIFIMLSVWGILAIGTKTFFGTAPVIPQLPTSGH